MSLVQNDCERTPMDFKNQTQNSMHAFESFNLKHLGGDIFTAVNEFLGYTRVHVRRYIINVDGELQSTKDGVSISPKLWHSLCSELKTILKEKSSEKVFMIEKDLCISKQVKDGKTVFVFQRLFQRQNCSMQFVPEFVMLDTPQFEKLCESVNVITNRLKEKLITYSLAYYIQQELDNQSVHLKPLDNLDDFSELLDSLKRCLCVSLTLKITELIKCFGCREFIDETFMHDCVETTRSEKWSAFFDQALYLINLKDVAKDIVQKNLKLDFNYVLGQREFFDALDVERLFKSIKKMYIGEEQTMCDD